MLYGEWVHTSIVASDLQTSMREADCPDQVQIRQEPLDPDEVVVLVPML